MIKAVKIDRTMADKASFVPDRRGISLAEFLTGLLKRAVDREFAKEMKTPTSVATAAATLNRTSSSHRLRGGV